jgi:hypothetical protein
VGDEEAFAANRQSQVGLAATFKISSAARADRLFGSFLNSAAFAASRSRLERRSIKALPVVISGGICETQGAIVVQRRGDQSPVRKVHLRFYSVRPFQVTHDAKLHVVLTTVSGKHRRGGSTISVKDDAAPAPMRSTSKLRAARTGARSRLGSLAAISFGFASTSPKRTPPQE